VYYARIGQQQPIISRMDESGALTSFWLPLFQDGITQEELGRAAEQLFRPFLLYFHEIEPYDYYNGYHPLVLMPFVPLLFFGAGYLLWRLRAPAIGVLICVAGIGFGNALVVNPWATPRHLGALPALGILMAVGLRYIPPLLLPSPLKQLKQRGSKTRIALLRISVAAAVIVSAVQVYYYFGQHLHTYARFAWNNRQYPDMFDATLRSVADYDSETTQTILISRNLSDSNLVNGLYVLYVNDRYHALTFTSSEITLKWLEELPRDRNYAFFVEPGENDVIALLQDYFPNLYPPATSPFPIPAEKEFIAYYAPVLMLESPEDQG
jgi:hypothetical protein